MKTATFPVKRANPRFPSSAEAEAIFRDGTSVDAQVLEISSHGCYIDTLEPIPVGTELQLRINNGTSTCELRGKVIYMHPGHGMAIAGMGVVFHDMASEQRSAIETWLRDLAANQSKSSPS